jgi:phosphoglycerol transferase MdoB-like AlkP superfamily enzyme
MKWISIVLLPIILASLLPHLSPFYSELNKRLWTWYLAVMTFFIFFFFGADFGNFAYNRTRLNASALNFVEDAQISLSMLWQSYPIFWLLIALVITVIFIMWLYRRSHIYVTSKTDGLGIPYRRRWFIAGALLLGLFVYGNLSRTPLSWNKAFMFQDNFKSYLALNPLQNFFTTLKFRKPLYNESTARSHFEEMKKMLQLPPTKTFGYKREILPGSSSLESHPNIVLVLCESFSMYKSSMSGNPLNTTPYFDQLTKKGIFFEKSFTPHFSTARGLFATLTGIPDVQLSKFSTRVPESQEQHTIINNFEGYNKFYFLGGSPGFNNFVGLLKNIDSLQMFTEGSLKSVPMNVWGISDKNLFLEANEHFSRQEKPFFAIIQTANNHRPFTIPEEDQDFEMLQVNEDTLELYGFESVQEFNAFRYTDYCFKKFMEKAEKEKYFANTIFVFVGDHGVSGNALKVYPKVWTEQRLTDMHVPLLFYAPHLLKPALRKETVSQVDVLPTVASMLHQPYINTTLGRNLLMPGKENNFAFIISHDEGKIGMLTDDYFYTQNINFKSEQLFPVKSNKLNLTLHQQDSLKALMAKKTIAYYETAKWMLKNNKKKDVGYHD